MAPNTHRALPLMPTAERYRWEKPAAPQGSVTQQQGNTACPNHGPGCPS